jgi:hypothetical protein
MNILNFQNSNISHKYSLTCKSLIFFKGLPRNAQQPQPPKETPIPVQHHEEKTTLEHEEKPEGGNLEKRTTYVQKTREDPHLKYCKRKLEGEEINANISYGIYFVF